VLLPPLTGIEAVGTDVEGDLMIIHSRLSLNLAAHTLEQVLASDATQSAPALPSPRLSHTAPATMGHSPLASSPPTRRASSLGRPAGALSSAQDAARHGSGHRA
jgi:hypothetical protein